MSAIISSHRVTRNTQASIGPRLGSFGICQFEKNLTVTGMKEKITRTVIFPFMPVTVIFFSN